jgi:predicted ester cyclase
MDTQDHRKDTPVLEEAPEVEPHGFKEVVSVGAAVAALAGGAAGTAAAAGAVSGAGGTDTVLVSTQADRNVEIARSYFEQVWNGDFAGGEKLASTKYGILGPQAADQGECGKRIAAIVDEYKQGFSDLRFDVQNVNTDGDTVTIEWVATGTHDGSFWGLEATHIEVTMPGSTTYTVRDSLITEEVYAFDVRGVFEQLRAGR